MSAFAVLFERGNAPLPPVIFHRMMERLAHRGPDGRDEHSAERLVMGHWHFWATPEEAGEKQPLQIPGLPFRLVLDGRLDNRSELLSLLRLDVPLSDTVILLHAYARWGDACFEKLVGEYAAVLYDETRGELVCARDALGDRTLFYCFQDSYVAVASEPWAAAAALPSVNLDERGTAAYFTFQPAPHGRTLFKDVFELPPAQVMTITSSGERRRFSWDADPSRRTRHKRDEEYAEEFRDLLKQSVQARLRSLKPAGVLMSGGLDSTSVACLAAQTIQPKQLKTISFVFDDPTLKECDERVYMDAVHEQWNTVSIQLPADDLWPYKDWEHWPQTPNRPDGNVFRRIKHLVYDRARDEGLGVLLTGEGGDHLYAAGADWLSDLLLDGKPASILPALVLQAQRKGWRNILLAGHLPRAVRALAKRFLPRALTARIRSVPRPPPWLTPHAASHWSPVTSRFSERLEGHENLLSLQSASGITAEIPLANRNNLELRHPYRDRRLVEYVLSLPAYQLYSGGLYKHILRNAMRGLLPEIIRSRPRPTALLALYQLGVERERLAIQAILNDPEAVWRRSVRSDWLHEHIDITAPADQVGTESMIVWLSVSFESWYKCRDWN